MTGFYPRAALRDHVAGIGFGRVTGFGSHPPAIPKPPSALGGLVFGHRSTSLRPGILRVSPFRPDGSESVQGRARLLRNAEVEPRISSLRVAVYGRIITTSKGPVAYRAPWRVAKRTLHRS